MESNRPNRSIAVSFHKAFTWFSKVLKAAFSHALSPVEVHLTWAMPEH